MLDYFPLKDECPKCGNNDKFKFTDRYSFPVIGAPKHLTRICEQCNHKWNVNMDYSKLTDEELSKLCAERIMGMKKGHEPNPDFWFSINIPSHSDMIVDKMVEKGFHWEGKLYQVKVKWTFLTGYDPYDHCYDGMDKSKHRAIAIAALVAMSEEKS